MQTLHGVSGWIETRHSTRHAGRSGSGSALVFQNVIHRADLCHPAAVGLALGLAAPKNALGLETGDHAGGHRFLLAQCGGDSAVSAPIR